MPVIKRHKSEKDKITNTVGSANWCIQEATSRMLGRLLNDLEDNYSTTGLPDPTICSHIQTALNNIATEVNQVYFTHYPPYYNKWQELNTKYVDWNSIGYQNTPSSNIHIGRRADLVKELRDILEKVKEIQNEIINDSNKDSKQKTFDKRLAKKIIKILVALSSNPSVSLPSFQQRVQEATKRRLI